MTSSVGMALRGERILLTGATGFLGRVLMEKLLWSVPDIGRVHVLIRPAGSQTAEQRFAQLIDGPLSARLRARHGLRWSGWLAERVHVVSGDLSAPQLGLTPARYEALRGDVSLVIGNGATVTFDERLDTALAVNIQGARCLLEFARSAGDAPLLHVSTCYVSGRREGTLFEQVTELPHDKWLPQLDGLCQQIRAGFSAKNGSGTASERSLRELLVDAGMQAAAERGFRDTYTLTKAIAESVLASEQGGVPLVVLRPSIIESALAEPAPGWIDGLRMADPVFVAYGRGKLAHFPGAADNIVDVIPVDYVANAIVIAAARAVARRAQTPPELIVYQVSSGAANPLKLGSVAQSVKRYFDQYPIRDARMAPVRLGSLRFVSPQHFARRVQSRRRRLELLKSVLPRQHGFRTSLGSWERGLDQIGYLSRIYGPYLSASPRYSDVNVRELWRGMSIAEQREFPFDVKRIDWERYITDVHLPGLRHYVLGEAPVRRVVERREASFSSIEEDVSEHVYEAFERTVARLPDVTLFQVQRRGRWLRYSYAQALRATTNLSRHFAGEFGIGPGQRVVIVGDNGPEWSLVVLALFRLGATIVPIDAQWPDAEIGHAAQLVSARLICLAPRLAGLAAKWQHAIPVVELCAPLIPDPEAPVVGTAPQTAPRASGDVACLMFTSGTIVAPKAVPLTHRNLISNLRAWARVLGLSRSRTLSILPVFHVMELMNGLVGPVAVGGTVTFVEKRDGEEITRAMRASGTTTLVVVPRLLELFLSAIEAKVKAGGPLAARMFALMRRIGGVLGPAVARRLFGRVHERFGGKIEVLVSAGAPLHESVFRAFREMGFPIAEAYGMTETSPVLALSAPGRARVGSVGPALPGVELRICADAPGGEGEILARGPGVMSGYFDNAQANAEAFTDGWFRTGDLGRLDAEGRLSITGRVKELIVTAAGKNVHPGEVERRYSQLTHVRELAVVGMPGARSGGEEVHAVIVPASVAGVADAAIQQEIEKQVAEISMSVPSYQRITQVHFWLGDLPKTSTLKVQRTVLRGQLLAGKRQESVASQQSAPAAPTVSRAEPSDPNERWVYAELVRLSGLVDELIRPEAHLLAELGIDSLAKMELIGSIEARFGITCHEDTVVAVERVVDLLALVRGLPPPVTTPKKRTSAFYWARLSPRI